MGKVNRGDFRSNQLSSEDIEDAAILTVDAYNEGLRADGGGKWGLFRFEETGDKPLFMTGAALDTMIEWYGDETDNWIGKSVPVEAYDGKNVTVRIMASEEWERAFKESDVKVPTKAARSAPRAAAARPGVHRGVKSVTGVKSAKRGKR